LPSFQESGPGYAAAGVVPASGLRSCVHKPGRAFSVSLLAERNAIDRDLLKTLLGNLPTLPKSDWRGTQTDGTMSLPSASGVPSVEVGTSRRRGVA